MRNLPTWYLVQMSNSSSRQIRQMGLNTLRAMEAAKLDPSILVAAGERIASMGYPPEAELELSMFVTCRTDPGFLRLLTTPCNDGKSEKDKFLHNRRRGLILKYVPPRDVILPENMRATFDRIYEKLQKQPWKYRSFAKDLLTKMADPAFSWGDQSIIYAFLYKLSEFGATPDEAA